MKALIVDSYGPPSQARIADVKTTELKDGYVLVRMHAAAVNPFDNKLLSGSIKEYFPIEFPYIPGMDGAGVIAGVGEGIEGYRIGDRVFGMFRNPAGTLAEFATIDGANPTLAPIPDGLDFVRAAAIPEAGLTALTILRAAEIHEDQRVFVIGATGGIGLFVTQLLKARGAHVIATAMSSDTGYMRKLGAEETVDYTAGDPTVEVGKRYPDGVDAVIDLVSTGGALVASAEIVRRDGTLVSSLYGPGQSAFPEDVTVRYVKLEARPGDLADLGRRAASGELHVEITETYPFAQAQDALADLANPKEHTRGKRVVEID